MSDICIPTSFVLYLEQGKIATSVFLALFKDCFLNIIGEYVVGYKAIKSVCSENCLANLTSNGLF